MPLLVGTLPADVSTKVKHFEKSMLDALEACRDALNGGGGGVNGKLTLWFGDNGAPFKKDMRDKIAKMRSILNNKNIECKQGGLSAGTNAQADHVTGGLFAKDGHSSLTRMTFMQEAITIGPEFPSLPEYAVGIPSAWMGQDKFETLLHELSHVAHGTLDVPNADGKTAYGAARARLLAIEDPNKAKNNAENWGLFIEEFRSMAIIQGPVMPG